VGSGLQAHCYGLSCCNIRLWVTRSGNMLNTSSTGSVPNIMKCFRMRCRQSFHFRFPNFATTLLVLAMTATSRCGTPRPALFSILSALANLLLLKIMFQPVTRSYLLCGFHAHGCVFLLAAMTAASSCGTPKQAPCSTYLYQQSPDVCNVFQSTITTHFSICYCLDCHTITATSRCETPVQRFRRCLGEGFSR
jgi:hypothetical protein